MKINWITALILASALAILALIAFQVRWMQHSQTLLEEQFNQRVNMALCNTVEKLAAEKTCSHMIQSSCSAGSTASCCRQLDTLLTSPLFDHTLNAALAFYKIDLPYQASILSAGSGTASDDPPPFSCTLNPLMASDSHYLQLDFTDKQDYILHRMGGMLGSSIFILLFICTIFMLATYHLIRQKRMSDLNREFFNHMAHEFRTPLTNIRLAGKMLSRKDATLQASPYLDIIRQEGQHLMQQVEQVLHMARLEQGNETLQKQPTDLVKLLQETVGSMELLQKERNANIELDLPARPLVCRLDALHFTNALRNLLDNALKYCTEKPLIQVSLTNTDSEVQLQMKDNGPGMDKEEWSKVFEKFYQSKHPTPRKGFGLGLAYVKRVIELHSGSIQLNSRPGQGSTFEIRLPL
ncbi:MAG: HAMP domain-containing sensor histidine kinase [Saprospiraceae bacterium]